MSKPCKEEYETHVWYNYQNNTVEFYTNIQKHVTAMTKLWGKPHESNGIGYSWTLPIESFRTPRPKRKQSPKQLAASRKSIAKLHKKRSK